MFKIYYAKILNDCNQPVLPRQRNDEIFSCLNLKTKIQKYSVWKLLEFAIFDTYQKKMDEVIFSKSENGKWNSDLCHFSLSHSENAVAVAISDFSVGVDVEMVKQLQTGIENKILNDKELTNFNLLQEREKQEFLIKKWTEKESYYKFSDKKNLSIKAIDTLNNQFFNRILTINGQKYYLSAFLNRKDSATVQFVKEYII